MYCCSYYHYRQWMVTNVWAKNNRISLQACKKIHKSSRGRPRYSVMYSWLLEPERESSKNIGITKRFGYSFRFIDII